MKNYISSERANLFEPNVYIQFLVKISGNPVTGDLVSALKTAFSNNQATMSKIVLDTNGTAYYEKMEESGCKIFISNQNWKDIIRENEKMPFNISHGELIRAFIIPSDSDTSLLIMAHHLAGDGKSIVYFLEDVLKSLAGELLTYKPLHLITENDFGAKFKLHLRYRMYAKNFNRAWKKKGLSFGWDDYYNIHEAYWKNHSSQIIYETFSKDEMNSIKLHAKTMGVTINTFLITALLKADMHSNITGIAVAARTDKNRSMSNQTTGISINYRYTSKKSFEENARLIHKKVYDNLNDPNKKYFVLKFISLFNPALIDSILLNINGLYNNKKIRQLAKAMGYFGDRKRNMGITNLTQIDIERKYGDFKIEELLFLVPAVSYAKRVIGASTIENEMNISFRVMSEESENDEQVFFADAIKIIREIINT